MKDHKASTMGALNSSIANLEAIRTTLLDVSHEHKALNWALGGIIVTLVSSLLSICNDVFREATDSGEANAKDDMQLIQLRFNNFMNRMVGNE